MLIIPKMSTAISRAKIPCQVQAKYDGELTAWNGEYLENRFGTKRVLPFCSKLPKDLAVIGELYYESGKGNFYKALSHLKGNDPNLNFAIFGLLDSNLPYVMQYETLRKVFNPSGQIHYVKGDTAYSMAEIQTYSDILIKDKWEGAVIKPLGYPSSYWIKYKPFQTLDLVVLGVVKGKCSCAIGTPERIMGHITIKGELSDLLNKSTIIGQDKEHYLIVPNIIVEIKHLGFIQTERGLSLRSPQFVRVRTDLGINDINREIENEK